MHVNNLDSMGRERGRRAKATYVANTYQNIFLNSFLFLFMHIFPYSNIYHYSDWSPVYPYPSYINVCLYTQDSFVFMLMEHIAA